MSATLKTRRDEIKDRLERLTGEAQAAWTALEGAKSTFAGAADTGPDSEAYKAVDEAGRDYGSKADLLAQTRGQYERLLELSADGPPAAPAGEKTGPERHADPAPATPAQRVTAGDEYKRLVASGRLNSTAPIGIESLGKALDRPELKAALTGASATSAGAFVRPDRKDYYPLPLRPVRLLDAITLADTDSDTVEYVKQTGFTNAAAETAEATDVSGASGTKPQSDAAFQVVQSPVQTIPHWFAATKRALADAGQLRAIIDQLLTGGIQLRLEQQLVNGNGTAPNLRGVLNTSGIGNIATGGGGSISDRVQKGTTLIRLGFFEPNAVLIHPSDWETVRLSRDDSGASAGTGGYLYGPPSLGGATTMWGLQVIPSPVIAAGTVLVGDFSQLMLWVREGVEVLASDSHADFFVRNLVAVLAEGRFASGIPYPGAFTKVATV